MNPELKATQDFIFGGSNENNYPEDSDDYTRYEKQWALEADTWLINDFREQQLTGEANV